MPSFKTPALAVAALALLSIATPSFAGSPYYDEMGEPMTMQQADMVHDGMMDPEMMQPGMMASPQSRGHFSCLPNERRTRLARKACGRTKNVY